VSAQFSSVTLLWTRLYYRAASSLSVDTSGHAVELGHWDHQMFHCSMCPSDGLPSANDRSAALRQQSGTLCLLLSLTVILCLYFNLGLRLTYLILHIANCPALLAPLELRHYGALQIFYYYYFYFLNLLLLLLSAGSCSRKLRPMRTVYSGALLPACGRSVVACRWLSSLCRVSGITRLSSILLRTGRSHLLSRRLPQVSFRRTLCGENKI